MDLEQVYILAGLFLSWIHDKKFKFSYLYPLPFGSLGTLCFCWAL